MKKVKMLESTQVQTSKGPVNYGKGEVHEVEDWISDSLQGRLMAELVEEKIAESLSMEQLETMTVKDLRVLGRDAKVPDYNSMKKDDLVAALAPVEQPYAPFEEIPLDGESFQG